LLLELGVLAVWVHVDVVWVATDSSVVIAAVQKAGPALAFLQVVAMLRLDDVVAFEAADGVTHRLAP